MKQILENGTSYVYKDGDLLDEVCKQDLIAALKRGNHKSALKKEKVLESAFKKEINFGYQLPLKPSHILKIPGACLSPMGVADQLTISELGEVIQKDRVTHNLSFPGEVSGESINSMIDDNSLFVLIYGHTHSRCIHQIVATQKRFPSSRILGNKADFKSMHRRQHLAGKAALHSVTQANLNNFNFILMALRLIFGGQVCPFDWCSFSKPIVDLANALLDCKDWDPDSLHSPAQDMVPPTEYLLNDIPLAQARDL